MHSKSKIHFNALEETNAVNCNGVAFHRVAMPKMVRSKVCLILILQLFLTIDFIAAQTISKSINLTFEYGIKKDFYKESQTFVNSEEIIKGRSCINAYTERFSFQIGYTSSANFLFELAFLREDFQIGWNLKKPYGVASEWLFESASLFPVRISKKFFLFNKNLFVAPGFGYVLGFSKTQASLGDGISTTILMTDEHVFTISEVFSQGKEYDIKNFWGMLEIRSNIGLNINKNFGFYVGGGVWLGNKVVGRTNVEYLIDGTPTGKIFNESKGSNFFFIGGLTYAFSIP